MERNHSSSSSVERFRERLLVILLTGSRYQIAQGSGGMERNYSSLIDEGQLVRLLHCSFQAIIKEYCLKCKSTTILPCFLMF